MGTSGPGEGRTGVGVSLSRPLVRSHFVMWGSLYFSKHIYSLLFLTEIQLIYRIILVSGVQPSDSVFLQIILP